MADSLDHVSPVLSFVQDVDPGSAKVAVPGWLQVMMQPALLFIPRRVHDNFIVHDLLVSGIPQHASRTREDESGLWVDLLSCAVSAGQEITIVVENTSKQTQQFRADIVGAAQARA